MLPRIRDRRIDQVAISFPVRVCSTAEQTGDVMPMLPTMWCCGDHSSGETTRDRDVNFFAVFEASERAKSIRSKR